MSRIRLLALPALVALLAVLPAATASAASTKTCKLSISKSRSLGPAYVTYSEGKPGFKVKGVGCSTGQSVIKAYHACRYKKGEAGRCTTKVKGYSCTEKRGPSSPIGYDADVTCKSGDKRVVHTYQQNLE